MQVCGVLFLLTHKSNFSSQFITSQCSPNEKMHQLGVFRSTYFQNTSDEKFCVVCLQDGIEIGHGLTEDVGIAKTDASV